MDKKVSIENEYKSEGSFNVVFVSEYKANAIMLLYSYLNPNFDIYKKEEYLATNETYEIMNYRNVLEMEEANDNATASLNNLIDNDKYKDIKYGIKLCNKNIGFNGKFYTFPYFLTFLLKRYLKEKR